MKIGCFALVSPFSTLDTQLQQLASLGFQYADVTDNSDGACLGAEFGFTALASLDANPFELQRTFEKHNITITSYCAHSNLLDPAAPWRYGNPQIIKAIRSAAAIGVKHVITTEGDPTTDFAESLSDAERVLIIAEKLFEPLKVAADHGVKILFEPHGPVSGRLDLTEDVLTKCNSEALALNLDTGNLWLAGTEPLDYIKRFGHLIEHVHWKDLPGEMEEQRGKVFGCGMATIPLGSGVIGIKEIVEALKASDFDGYTTLEVAGEDAVIQSRDFLNGL